MKRSEMYFTLAKIPTDFTAAISAWWLARMIRPITDLVPGLHSWFDPKFIPDPSFFLPFSFYTSIGYLCIAATLGAYRFPEEFNWSKEIPRILLSSLFWGMSIISFYTLLYREVIFSRIMLAQAMVFIVLLIILFRFLMRIIQISCWKRGKGVSRIVLLGSEKNRAAFTKIIHTTPEFLVVDGYNPKDDFSSDAVDEIWHIEGNLPPQQEKRLRDKCHREHKVFRFIPSSSEVFARMDLQVFGGVPVLRPTPAALSGWGQIFKRSLDILGSILCFILLFPLLLLLGIGVRITSRGPVLYGSKRIGRYGEEFTLWKFRSMIQNAETLKNSLQKMNHRNDSPFFKIKNDPRVTIFGKFLRRFSLDELPQLWNVLRGEMSLIGSRPHLPEEIQKFSPEKTRILSIKPGITGLAQVSGRSDLSFEEEIRLDTYYLENWSFWLDLKIFLKTIWVVLQGKGAD